MQKILILLFVTQLCGLAQIVCGQEIDGHVTLVNGDRIPAKIHAYDNEQIKFGSSLFSETVRVKPEYLSSFGFLERSTDTTDDVVESFDVTLKSGNRLSGQLLSIDDEACELASPVLGTAKIPLANLVEVRRRQSKLLLAKYSAINWQQLSTQHRVDSHGHLKISRKRAESKTDNSLVLPQKLEKDTNIEIEFLAQERAEFKVLLRYSGGNELATVGVTGGELLIESADDLVFGEFISINGIAKLSINRDADNGVQILNEFGQAMASIPWDKDGSLSVVIQNESGVLKIREIKVFSQSQAVKKHEFDHKQTIVWAGSDKPHAAQSVTIKDQNVVATSADEAKQHWNLSDLDRVWFGHDLSPATSSVHSKYVCCWLNGDRLELDDINLSDSRLAFDSDEFESSDSIDKMFPTEILVTDVLTKASPQRRSETQFKLAISGIPFSGIYTWGDSSYPVRWQFLGFTEPVALDIKNRSIEIDRVASSESTASKHSPDLVFLNDGSILPCKVGVASNKNLRLESDRFEISSVPMPQVSSVFFDSRSRRLWRSKLTRETIQKALTRPRFQRDATFEHVLIGKNGDLLRGVLIEIGKEFVGFESRYEVLEIARENVAGIVMLNAEADAKADVQRDVADNQGEKDAVAHVDCGNNFVAVGKYVSLNDQGAVIESSVLGRLTLDSETIGRIAFNSKLGDVNDLQEFTSWKMEATIDPRWEEKLEQAANAYELKDQVAPDFELPMLADSRSFRLDDHAGKVIVLYFWESTSRPSTLGLPQYMSVIEKFSPRDVEFLALNQGELQSVVHQFIQSKNLNPLKIGMDHNHDISHLHKVTAIPHLTVIDREGVIRSIQVGYSPKSVTELESKIRELLK